MRRHWIGHLSKICGTLHLDKGAVTALMERGSSLLAVGISSVEGSFARGDAVAICGPDGTELGRGLVGYTSDEVGRIAGLKSHQIAPTLQQSTTSPVIHRNDLSFTQDL